MHGKYRNHDIGGQWETRNVRRVVPNIRLIQIVWILGVIRDPVKSNHKAPTGFSPLYLRNSCKLGLTPGCCGPTVMNRVLQIVLETYISSHITVSLSTFHSPP